MKFILAPSAIADLESISTYFLANNVEAGEKLFQKINKRFQSLTQFPKLGKPYPHLHPDNCEGNTGKAQENQRIFCGWGR